jgi:transcription-repair coupling factor (superfamily II helicase)
VPRPATARIGGKPLVGRDLLRWTAEFLTTVLDN